MEKKKNVGQEENAAVGTTANGKINEYFVGVAKDIFNFINKSSWKALFKVVVVVLVGIVLYFTVKTLNMVTNEENIAKLVANKIEEHNTKSEELSLSIREDVVTPKIQRELEILCYSLNADRAFIFELHNGKVNSSGLPFRYADMSYEEPNEERDIERVAMQFQDIPLTLYRYPHYLAENKYIYGNINEIAMIDNGFAKHIERVGGRYLGMLYLTNKGLPLGFLCVSFHDEPVFSEDEIKSKLEQYGRVIGPLLDMGVQVKNI